MIDHIVWGAADLETACDTFERMTGVTPLFGGRHTNGGTWNALVSLGERQYFEIIAPNPSEPMKDPWRDALSTMTEPAIFKLCMSPDQGLDQIAAAARAAGIAGEGPFDDGRIASDGTRLHWQLFMPDDDDLPFFIDWLDSPHPGASVPASGCELVDCWIEHPDAIGTFGDRLSSLGISIPVEPMPVSGIRAKLSTPQGLVEL